MTSGASTNRIDKNNAMKIDNNDFNFAAGSGDPTRQAYGDVNGLHLVEDQDESEEIMNPNLNHIVTIN